MHLLSLSTPTHLITLLIQFCPKTLYNAYFISSFTKFVPSKHHSATGRSTPSNQPRTKQRQLPSISVGSDIEFVVAAGPESNFVQAVNFLDIPCQILRVLLHSNENWSKSVNSCSYLFFSWPSIMTAASRCTGQNSPHPFWKSGHHT